MTAHDEGLRVRFAKRRDPGLLWGRTLPQLCCLVTAVLLLVAAVRVGPPAGWWLAFGAATVTVLGFARWHGRALLEQLPAAAINTVLSATGQGEYRGGPYRHRTPDTDQPQLPGPLSRLQIRGFQISPEGGDIGVVFDRADGTAVSVVQIAGGSTFLQDDREVDIAAVAFGRLLDGLAHGGAPIVAIQALTRVRPDVADDARRDLRMRGTHGNQFARRINEAVLTGTAGTGLTHESYLAVRIAPHRARTRLRQFGGGDTGVAAMAYHSIARLTTDLTNAGVQVLGWVSPRGLAGLIRSALDPSSDEMVSRRGGGRGDLPGGDPGLPSGVSPRAAEPLLVRRARSYLAHCDSYSRTWWIEELPHADSGAPIGFLAPLLLGLPCRHTLSITLQPVDPRHAQRSIDAQTSTAEAKQQMDERIRRRHRRTDQQQAADVSRRESDLVEGFATYRLAVAVTVTAGSLDELEVASAQAESAINSCGMEGQVWYIETDQAYYLAALPLARGLR